MSLKETLSNDLKDAMRQGDALRRDTLRSVLTAISNAEVARVDPEEAASVRTDLNDDDVQDVVRKQFKQRRDSAAEFRKGSREDLASREDAEAEILATYLPKQLSREEIAAEVRTIIDETGASGPGDKAKVMPAAMSKLKERAEGRLINEVVTELLAG
jgi:uncharacterized protein YqeY